MLFHTIEAALRTSDDITVVLNHRYDMVKSAIEENFDGIKIRRQDAENFPGTGGALMGIPFERDRVLVLNADMPLLRQSSLEKIVSAGGEISMSVIEMENPSGYGRVVIEEGEVKAIVEEKDCSDSQKEIQTVNAGVYCFDRDILERYLPHLTDDNAQKEYYITDIVTMSADEGGHIVPVYVDEEEFMGVNSRYELSIAEERMQKRIKKDWMLSGVTIELPDTVYIDCRARFEGECIVENGVRIEGETLIVSSHIKAHTVVEDSHIVHSDAGPMAHIRPGCHIENSHIGNFVEVKKGNLDGVKAGHLSYLGDCDIGEGTNIGAGTITCNYDGKSKHKTVIGKNVFIGSDTQLVAPVEISDDTMVGAGSTITSNVPRGALAVTRIPMKIVEGFYYRFFST
jgi:bifunctional UDP-N-acetylglucosamine pyrophosphorylase/glucosamine-1-phosphate N-acetyltransferase